MEEVSVEAAIIEQGIADAIANEEFIDEPTARLIASELHAGQFSALYGFASTGQMDGDRMCGEILVGLAEAEICDNSLFRWYAELGRFVVAHT